MSPESNSKTQKKMVIIFDLDGTVFKTRDVVISAVNKSLEDVGLPAADDCKIISVLGEKTDVFCKKLTEDGTPEQRSAFVERLIHHEIVQIQKQGTLFQGTEEVLERLKKSRYPLAICSNGSRQYVEFVLDSMDISDLFDHVSSGQNEKPKGEMIKDILDHFDTDHGLMVGDSIQDIQGAACAGIPSIGVSYGYGDVNDAVYKIEALVELLDVIDQVQG
ncbi:MAG: HAD family hydrolase [Thermoplasmata archaeon]